MASFDDIKNILQLRKRIHENGIDLDLLELEEFFFARYSKTIGEILSNAKSDDQTYFYQTTSDGQTSNGRNEFISQTARYIV